MSNYFAQTVALINGKTEAEVLAEFEGKSMSKDAISTLVPFKVFEGKNQQLLC